MLGAIAVGLVAASTIGQAAHHFGGHNHVLGLVPQFRLDGEANVPTWFSSAILLSCAGLLAAIALLRRRAGAPWAAHWAGLSVIFLFLSVDEASEVHEMLIEPGQRVFDATGLLHQAWLIPYLAFALLVGLAYLRFVGGLSRPFRRYFIAAGAMYIAGAAGVESIGGWWIEQYGQVGLTYIALWTVEESLEMVGGILFLYALMRYLQEYAGDVLVEFGADPEAADGSGAPAAPSEGPGRAADAPRADRRKPA